MNHFEQQTNIISLKSKMASGFSTLLVREFLLKICAFSGQLILARILSPDDFGFYAIIIFIINLFGLFSDIGLSSALIQKKEPPADNELATIFFIKCALSISLVILIFIASPFTRIFYPSFTSVHIFMLQITSFVLFIMTLRSIPIVLLEREMAYARISQIDIFGIVAYYVTALFFAFYGFHIWSFIFATLIKEIVELCIVYIYKPWFPKFTFDYNKIKHLLRFGFFIQGSGLLNFLNNSITPLLGGMKRGPYGVGLLNWASHLALAPQDAVTNNFGRVAFSGLSRIQHDKKLLLHLIEKSASVITIISLLFPVLIFGFGQEGTAILYTNKWLPGITALYWFAASTIFGGVIVALGQGILALGKSKNIFFITLIGNINNFIFSFLLLFLFDYTGIAIASCITTCILFLLYVNTAQKAGIHIPLVKILLPKLGISIATLLLIFWMNSWIPQQFFFLIIKILIAICSYIILMFLFSKNDVVALLVVTSIFFKMYKFAEFAKKLTTSES